MHVPCWFHRFLCWFNAFSLKLVRWSELVSLPVTTFTKQAIKGVNQPTGVFHSAWVMPAYHLLDIPWKLCCNEGVFDENKRKTTLAPPFVWFEANMPIYENITFIHSNWFLKILQRSSLACRRPLTCTCVGVAVESYWVA